MRFFSWFPVVLVVVGCADGPIEVEGTWTDGFATHTINSAAWQTDGDYGSSRFDITVYDNAEGWAVAQNGADNGYNAGLWSRFEWVTVDDQLYYCQIAFDEADETAALDAGPADDADPASGGCGDFAWSPLDPL